jgi:hypothetical protein
MGTMISNLVAHQKAGVLGPGKEIACDLPFDLFGTLEFLQTVARKTALNPRKHRDQLTLSAEHRSAPPLGPLQLELASDPNAGVQLKMAAPIDPKAAAALDPLLSRIMLLLTNAPEPSTVEALRAKLQVRN